MVLIHTRLQPGGGSNRVSGKPFETVSVPNAPPNTWLKPGVTEIDRYAIGQIIDDAIVLVALRIDLQIVRRNLIQVCWRTARRVPMMKDLV